MKAEVRAILPAAQKLSDLASEISLLRRQDEDWSSMGVGYFSLPNGMTLLMSG